MEATISVLTIPYAGIGTTLGYRTGSSGTYTNLALLEDDCGFSGFENAVIEIKTLASGVVTKVAGRTDSGTFSGSCYLVNADAGVSELISLANSKALVFWQVMLPDGTPPTGSNPPTGSTYTFSGFVSSIVPGNFSGEDSPTLEFEIAISGLVSIAEGS